MGFDFWGCSRCRLSAVTEHGTLLAVTTLYIKRFVFPRDTTTKPSGFLFLPYISSSTCASLLRSSYISTRINISASRNLETHTQWGPPHMANH